MRMSVEEAAKRMKVSKTFIRCGLQQNKFDFGVAVKMSDRWTYYIDKHKFERFLNE